MSPADVVSALLLVSGAAVVTVACVGLQRFDSVFARIHPATKAITLGVVLIALGAAPRMQQRGDVAKLLLAASLQLLTAPIASHMVARAAYRAGTELSPRTTVDELAGVDLEDRERPRPRPRSAHQP